jgi:hypothetical protein
MDALPGAIERGAVADLEEDGGPIVRMQIRGVVYQISAEDIRRVARTNAPDSIVGYYVEVDGTRYRPKQLIRLVTGTRDAFNSTNARSVLTRLGFVVKASH